jgi:hypothetical protein
MTRATITIKRRNGLYCQLWYVNSDGYPKNGLGQDIFENLKTVDDVERAVAIFKKTGCAVLETGLTLNKDVNSIEPILEQCNDYSYVLDEATGKWGFYKYKENKLYDLKTVLKEDEAEDDDNNKKGSDEKKDFHDYEFERKDYPCNTKKMSLTEMAVANISFFAGMNEVARIFGYEVEPTKAGNKDGGPWREWYKLLKKHI